MTWRILAAFFLAFSVLAARAAPSTDAVLAEIGTALERGDAAKAGQLASDALTQGGLSALQRGRLLLDLGLAHELQGDQTSALTDFTRAIETHALPMEERSEALLQRGFLLDGLNRLDDAAKDYGAVITLKSANAATALNNRANIWRRQSKFAEAKRDYQAALAAGSGKPQFPYYGLGQIAEAQKDTEAARGFYAKAVAADPGYELAADRLAALGGPPEGALAEPDRIVLRPPGSKPVTSTKEDQPIVLRPPRARAASARPAAKAPPAEAMLRPALDGPSGAPGPEVQLGAWRSEPEAQAGWHKIHRQLGSLLDGKRAYVLKADIPGKGRYFRLRVPTRDAAGLCADIRSAGVTCIRAPD